MTDTIAMWIVIGIAIALVLILIGAILWNKLQWERYKRQRWNQIEKECAHIEKHGF